jgi:hypothetical protein
MRRLVLLIMLTFSLSVLWGQGPSVAASTKAGQSAELMTVRGIVTASGRAVSGVAVKLYAWPDQAVSARLKPGQVVPLVLVGSATTAADGSYLVRVPEAALVPEATNGVVNMEADSGSASYSFPWALSARAARQAAVSNLSSVTANLSNGVPWVCGGVTKVASLGPQWARVGQTYVPVTGASQTFTYDQGQSSSLGVGYSGSSGRAGSFHADGTASWSTDTGQGFPTYGGRTDVWYRTEFIYGKYKRVCLPCPTCGLTTAWYARPDGYAGGTSVQTRGITTPTANHCVPELAGATFWRDFSSAVTWSSGVYVAPLLLNLSAQTGYSSHGHVFYRFSRNRHLCGTNNYPGQAAQDVVKS